MICNCITKIFIVFNIVFFLVFTSCSSDDQQQHTGMASDQQEEAAELSEVDQNQDEIAENDDEFEGQEESTSDTEQSLSEVVNDVLDSDGAPSGSGSYQGTAEELVSLEESRESGDASSINESNLQKVNVHIGDTFNYVVVRGDYLSKIAKKVYGDMNKWRNLAAVNTHIRNPNLIFPGETLKIPVDNSISLEFASMYLKLSPGKRMMISEIVKPGDSLSKIAKRVFGSYKKWHDIWYQVKAEVPNPNVLEVGQTLTFSSEGVVFGAGMH